MWSVSFFCVHHGPGLGAFEEGLAPNLPQDRFAISCFRMAAMFLKMP
jgi:hypothetical protein